MVRGVFRLRMLVAVQKPPSGVSLSFVADALFRCLSVDSIVVTFQNSGWGAVSEVLIVPPYGAIASAVFPPRVFLSHEQSSTLAGNTNKPALAFINIHMQTEKAAG